MKDKIVVIGRSFGSGGRVIGRRLAETMGVPFYDRELLCQASSRLGVDLCLMEHADERRPSIFRSMIECALGNPAPSYDLGSLNTDRLYQVQSHVIKQLGTEGGAVFVGRTADYILRDHPYMLSVFLHAPELHRARRVLERGDCDTLEHALELTRKRDRLRQGYYNYFTGRNWGQADNYDLCVDTSLYGEEGTVSVIRHALELMNR